MLSCGGNLVGDFALGKPPYRHFPDHQLFIHLDSSRLVNNRMIAASRRERILESDAASSLKNRT